MIEFLDKPLTVERVLAAYAKTGLKPRDSLYAIAYDGELCGCALGAVAIAEGAATFNELCAEEDEFDAIDAERPLGFTDGFDDLPLHNPRYQEAYELGQACRKAVGL